MRSAANPNSRRDGFALQLLAGLMAKAAAAR
jgi:hypothetical protein